MKKINTQNILTCTFANNCPLTTSLLKEHFKNKKGTAIYYRPTKSVQPLTDMYVLFTDSEDEIRAYFRPLKNFKKTKIVVTSTITDPILRNSIKYGVFGVYERSNFLDTVNLNLVHLWLYRETITPQIRDGMLAKIGLLS